MNGGKNVPGDYQGHISYLSAPRHVQWCKRIRNKQAHQNSGLSRSPWAPQHTPHKLSQPTVTPWSEGEVLWGVSGEKVVDEKK